MIRRISLFAAVCTLATSAFATTFVVPSDRHLVSRARGVVVGKAVTSYTHLNDRGAVETVTTIEVEEVLKGRFAEKTFKVHEPGGQYGEIIEVVPGTPRFRDGERVVLLVNETKAGRWVVHNLALGKFTIAKDRSGRAVALRQEDDIHGWAVDGKPHSERRRDAVKFMDFIRAVAAGKETDDDAHFIPLDEQTAIAAAGARTGSQSHSTYSAGSYLFSHNIRWNTFPRTFTHTNTLSGAANGGVDAITTAIGLWTNDTGSSVILQHGGLDATKTSGILASDGANAIRWEVDMTDLGAPAYTCGSGGVLGLGNIRGTVTPHTGPDGASFATATEGDIDMNAGLANCQSLFNSTVFVNGLTHEFGHTLGFRHSDQDRTGNVACPGGDHECSSSAVMNSFIPNQISAALQTYDQNAVRAVYPQAAVPVPAVPTGLSASAVNSSTITLSWNGSATATSYKIFRRGAGETLTEIGTTTTTGYTDSIGLTGDSAYLYVVRASNTGGDSAESTPDIATTILFTDPSIAPGTVIKEAHFSELRAAVNAVRDLAGLDDLVFNAPAPGLAVPVSKSHVDDLRLSLAAARAALGVGSLVYTDPEIVAGTTAVKAIHVTQLRNGVL